MNKNYFNFYNNLVNLTRNKNIYNEFTSEDTFSDRLVIFLFHFAFFLKIFKYDSSKKSLQELFDYVFKQLELSLREEGLGDAGINKRMKNYINLFYSILDKIDKWDEKNLTKKNEILINFLNIENKTLFLVKYFDNYRSFLSKNTFNSLIKGVIKLKF